MMQEKPASVVDWSALASRYSGRSDFVDRLIAVSIEAYRHTAGELLAHAADPPAVERLAHALKGFGGNVCAPELVRQATLTLAAARTAEAASESLARELAAQLERVLAELQDGGCRR